jgi:hypothetical protein
MHSRLARSFLTPALFACLTLAAGDAPARAGEVQVARWTRFEAQFAAEGDYENPVQDVEVEVEFSAPSGARHTALAFWDGGKTWKVRFAPDETGTWSYRSRSSKAEDAGLHDRSGQFTCVPYMGNNLLYRHGTIRVAPDRRYLVHADGTPWFWLADTAWNGALKADLGSWSLYIADRKSKQFTAVQFVTTQWLAGAGNADLRVAWLGREKIWIDPAFFQWMDERVDALNDAGLVAAPVLVWAAHWNKRTLDLNPGTSLPDDQIIVLARYMAARWGAHHVIWILAGDSDYRGERAERWKKIGRAVFGENPSRLATMHPAGQQWIGAEFRGEPWFSLIGYQSGHGDSDEAMRWLVEGPPAQQWRAEPVRPIINLEPNYEGHIGYTHRKVFDAHAVRRAAYWSLLVSPPAGVTYGGHGVWSWELKAQLPMSHPGSGVARPWAEAIRMPGSVGMRHLRTFFDSFEWWRLRPAQELLGEQPGVEDPSRFVAAAKSEDGRFAVAYLPAGGTVHLNLEGLPSPLTARWFNPRDGRWQRPAPVSGPTATLSAPSDEDWALWLGPPK